MEDVKVKVRAFLSRFFRKREIGDAEDIFTLGFVNSLFAMQLVMYLEKEFALRIQPEDLDFENFRTINSIAGLVDRLTKAA
ncbi:hypothetical protein PCCS19_16460 [Paenibacillus sp. CCS19]|uniref:acyl carrier protein n=1 Tax=Paenibacillus sp. CCS19 TaxID=3158387 RepID=UPI0025635D80|nr:acyl carrier protein [Paenibacillus cellulosilyticus]GMK38592.1 hypothetical protein PCCS19_16460 [Paenibacillus cellulosilyticus]